MTAAIACLALLAFVPGASADDLVVCAPGSGAGQCQSAGGLATDFETGRLYVADSGNNRVDVFKVAGSAVEFEFAFGWGVKDGSAEAQVCTTASGCQKGLAGSGAGQFSSPRWIAVDNNEGSTSRHDIYVGTDNRRVQKFDATGSLLLSFGTEGSGECQFNDTADPISVGPAGNVFVGDTGGEAPNRTGRVEKFSPTGTCLGETTIFKGKPFLETLAVDAGEDAYLALGGVGLGVLRKYDLGAPETQLCAPDDLETRSVALDEPGNLFAAQREGKIRTPGSYRILTEYDSACNRLRRFAYGSFGESPVPGVAAFHSAAGDIFASESGKGVLYLSPPAQKGPVIAPPSREAFAITTTKATLAAEVNPEGKASTYRFEYVDLQSFETEGGFASPNTKSTPDIPIPIKAGSPAEEELDRFTLHAAEAEIGCPDPVGEIESGTCLAPLTKYRFRVLAENADGEGNSNSPVEGEFETGTSPEFGQLWSTDVGVDAAELHGEANPLGIPTDGWFEYVDDATYQKDVKELGEGHGFDHAAQSPDVAGGEAPIDFGAGEAQVTGSTSLFPLAPGTLYHYRLVAEDPLIEPLPSEEQTFKTFAAKQAEAPCPANEAFRGGASALLPDCRAYEMVSPLQKNNGDILAIREFSTELPAVLNQSSTSGSRLAYGTYRAFGDAKSGAYTSQYIVQRHERGTAGEGWQSHGISPPRGRALFNVFPSLDTEFKAFSPDLCYAWLRTVVEAPLAEGGQAGYPNLYRRSDGECGSEGYEALSTAGWENLAPKDKTAAELELQGLSADGARAIFVAPDSLEGSGAPNLGGGKSQLYLWSKATGPVFACVLPNGEALGAACSGGRGAGGPGGEGRSRAAGVQGAISADGQRVFWTAAGQDPGKIYLREHPEQGQVPGECEGTAACTIAVSSAGEALSGKAASAFQMAASDGSATIFTSGEDLYRFEVASKTTTLIAHHALPGVASGILGASADASRIYFASTDVMGEKNSEGEVAQASKPNLYLYEGGTVHFIGTLVAADTELSGSEGPGPIDHQPVFHLARVSPDGQHAAFVSKAPLTGYDNTDAVSGKADTEVFLYDAAVNGGAGKLICASCNPSGARPAGEDIIEKLLSGEFWAAAQLPGAENTLYAPHVLSDNGKRLFFEAVDSLVARDTNGAQDVYEWEAVGTGGCDEGDVTFSAAAQGCIDLVSSGQSAKDSEFVDASPSGDDVFFTTLSSLIGPDYGLVDLYDARIDGGFPDPPAPKVECEGETCQSPPAPPEAPTPSSSLLGPPRQVVPADKKGCPKGKRAVKRKGKTRCLARKPKPKHKQGGKR